MFIAAFPRLSSSVVDGLEMGCVGGSTIFKHTLLFVIRDNYKIPFCNVQANMNLFLVTSGA